MVLDDTAKLILGGAVTLAVTVLGWLGSRLWFASSRVHIDVEEASARYLAYDWRVTRAPPVRATEGPMQLVVRVRVSLHNRGPLLRSLTRAELSIGAHDARPLVEPAYLAQGARFSKLEIPAWDGFEVVDLEFIFGSDAYGLRGGWDYSREATYELILTTSRRRRDRFELRVLPPEKSADPAPVTVKRVRFWSGRVRMASTTTSLEDGGEQTVASADDPGGGQDSVGSTAPPVPGPASDLSTAFGAIGYPIRPRGGASVFQAELGQLANTRAFRGFVLGQTPEVEDGIGPDKLDAIEEWVHRTRPNAEPNHANSQGSWWLEENPARRATQWMAWLKPGVVLSILEACSVQEVGGRGVISLPVLVEAWATLIDEMKLLGAPLAVDRAQLGLILQTYGSDQDEHIYDLVFDDHPVPKRGANREMPPPPWSVALEPKHLSDWGRTDLRPAVIDLLDRFSYRHPESLLESLGLTTPAV